MPPFQAPGSVSTLYEESRVSLSWWSNLSRIETGVGVAEFFLTENSTYFTGRIRIRLGNEIS